MVIYLKQKKMNFPAHSRYGGVVKVGDVFKLDMLFF